MPHVEQPWPVLGDHAPPPRWVLPRTFTARHWRALSIASGLVIGKVNGYMGLVLETEPPPRARDLVLMLQRCNGG